MNKLLKNEYLFSIVTKGFMVVIGLLESVLLARYLGAELRGELSYVYSIASTGYLIITFGMYTAYPFERKNYNNSRDIQELINQFFSQILTLFIVYFVISTLFVLIFFTQHSNMAFVLILLPVLGLDKILTFVYLIERPNGANFFEMISNCVQCLFLVIAFVVLPKSVFHGVLYYLVGCILRIIYYYKKLCIRYDVKKFEMHKIIGYAKFGFFPMIALLLTTLNYRLDVIMLKQYSSVTLASMGIYSIGIGLSEKALLIPDTVKNVLISKLAKGKGEEEVARVMRICFLASIMTAIGIMLLGKLVIDFLYGSEYAGAEQITYVAVWGTTVMVFFKMVSQYNVVQHRQHLNVIFLSIAILLNIVFNMLLIPSCGIMGAAIATIIGHLVSSLIFLIYFYKVSNIPISKMIIIQKEDLNSIIELLKKR